MIYLLTLLDPTKEFMSVCRCRRFSSQRELCDFIKKYFHDHDCKTSNKRKKLYLANNAFFYVIDGNEKYKPSHKEIPLSDYIKIKVLRDESAERAKELIKNGNYLFNLEEETNREKLERYYKTCPY